MYTPDDTPQPSQGGQLLTVMLTDASIIHTPQFFKEMSTEYLEGDHQNDEGHGEEGRPADLAVDQVCEDSQVERADPQEMYIRES